jgi:hypothetical protein
LRNLLTDLQQTTLVVKRRNDVPLPDRFPLIPEKIQLYLILPTVPFNPNLPFLAPPHQPFRLLFLNSRK